MRNLSKSIGSARSFLSAVCLLFVLVVTANAYTVVLRGGKRIEIPAQFTVTKSTLTYESSRSFFITLQMTAIDIPATEQANNETAGSLMARVAKQQQQQSVGTAGNTSGSRQSKARRSITNRDLETYARARVESDRSYEQKRKELGLPPLAEARAQAAEETERFWQELERKREDDEANDRAAELEAQIAALSNQLNYVQARVSERPYVGAYNGLGGPFYTSLGRTRIRPSLFGPSFGLPIGPSFGLPVGRPFSSFNRPFGFSSGFHGFRRSVVVPGVRFRGRIGFGPGPHGRRF